MYVSVCQFSNWLHHKYSRAVEQGTGRSVQEDVGTSLAMRQQLHRTSHGHASRLHFHSPSDHRPYRVRHTSQRELQQIQKQW